MTRQYGKGTEVGICIYESYPKKNYIYKVNEHSRQLSSSKLYPPPPSGKEGAIKEFTAEMSPINQLQATD